jgi:hypothetical protein
MPPDSIKALEVSRIISSIDNPLLLYMPNRDLQSHRASRECRDHRISVEDFFSIVSIFLRTIINSNNEYVMARGDACVHLRINVLLGSSCFGHPV